VNSSLKRNAGHAFTIEGDYAGRGRPITQREVAVT
jgi:hypothetical protein